MAIYRIKLFALSEGEHKEENDRKYCIDNNILAIGWGNSFVNTFEEYIDTIQEQKISRGQKTSLNNISNIKVDDYVWTQADGRTFLLGKVTSDIFINTTRKRIGPTRKCLWKYINFDDVPGKILSCFVGFGTTLQKVDADNNFQKYCDWLYTNKSAEIYLDNYKSLLHPDDLEDLLGLYLQKQFKYYILPSTNKQGSKLIEYELRNDNGEKACIQCKIGSSTVGKEIFEEFKNYKIFISTFRDDDYDKYGNNVKTIKIDTLCQWASENINILPERIKNYIKISKI